MKKKRILICPLHWGLGHATRCIPIIKELLSENAEVIIGADKEPLELLKLEFPQLEFVIFQGVNVIYPAKGNLAITILSFLPKFIKNIFREHKILSKVIKEKKIDAVISDNRYGLFTKKIPCIFITHQLNIHAKIVMWVLKQINFYFIKKYTECWIPDFEDENNLTGKLSHGNDIPGNCFYIGPLSRFEKKESKQEIKYDLLVLISGPEKQRTVFEKLIVKQLMEVPLKVLVVRGLPLTEEKRSKINNIEFVNHLPAKDLEESILSSKIIIARSGYSTIMDLVKLNRTAILIPTPGQTEQEYLAKYLKEKGIFYSVDQDHFDLEESLREYSGYQIPSFVSDQNLKNRVGLLLSDKI